MSPRQLVVKLLDRWEQTDAYADLLLESKLDESKFSDEDKALTQEIFFGVIRWQKYLSWIIKQWYRGSLEKAPRFLRYILQSSLYQLLFMDRIPAYAVIHEAVELAKTKGGGYWGNKINGILRTFERGQYQINLPDFSTKPIEYISIKYSHPEWLIERWMQRYGIDETISVCEANNKNPFLSLRANRTKIAVEQLQTLLLKYHVTTSRSLYCETFLQAKHLSALSQFEPFRQGLFSIQDTSAGLACELLAPNPGETVVDLCAAPGGKTSYLAELTHDQASILAVDLNYTRLKLMRQNLNRLGLKSAQLIQADGTQFSCDPVDKVMVDAPCSGLGVLAKRVDLRWKRTPEQIKELTELQFKLLVNAAKLLTGGGVLVYCTCTIEPEENEQIVEKFLRENKNFKIDPAPNYVAKEVTTSSGFIYTFPHRHGIDGSFAARLVKA